MKTIIRSAGLALPILVAFALTPGVWSTTVSAGEEPTEIIGFGEAKAVPAITFNQKGKWKGSTRDVTSFGRKHLGATGDTVGHRFTFAFGVTKDAKGNVQGQMFLRDHDMNMTISSDIVWWGSHPRFRDPVGIKANGLNYLATIRSSLSSVFVNGMLMPDYEFRAFMFDGDKDTVCISLRNPDLGQGSSGKVRHVYNWVGYVSSGDVKTK